MAIDNFVPEIWTASLLTALRSRLTYAQAGIINRDYEGEIENAGDTVHITAIADPTISTYTPWSTSITYAQLADSDLALVIDQSDYFAFATEDIERKQALPGAVEEATRAASYGMAAEIDDYVADTMYAGVNGTSNDLGAITVDISDNNAYNVLVQLRTTLTRDNVPDSGRFVVVPPEMYAALLQDNRFVDASASGSTATLRNGFVGRAAGFDVIESNRTPDPTASTYAVIAGHPMATTFALQLTEVEAIRLESAFKDGVRGLQLYGAKVVRPTCLAMASVVVQA